MTDDAQLLRRFVEEHSQPAFTEFVQRHLDWVYQSAFRRTRGRRDLTEEVVQQVFIAGARNAARLARHPAIPAWLYTATRYAASRAIISDSGPLTGTQSAQITDEEVLQAQAILSDQQVQALKQLQQQQQAQNQMQQLLGGRPPAHP